MGTDITAHIEVRKKDSPYWGHYAYVEIDRNYELFSILAGVRGFSDDQIDEPRGLPKDVSIAVQIGNEVWHDCGFSHSYIDFKEIWKVHKLTDELFNHNHRDTIHDLDRYHSEYGYDFRLVFWFDN